MSSVLTISSVSLPVGGANDLLWRFSVAQYHEMIRAGILTEDDPVELLEGLLITKMPKNPPHRMATHLTSEALRAVIPDGWYVDSQEPVTLADSEPEPDVCVIRGTTRDYAEHNPFAQDVALVIEVSDSTLEWDRESKRRVYAQAGIAVYWIVNLVDHCLEVYSNPTGRVEEPDYQESQIFADDSIVPVWIDGREVAQIAVQNLLP